MRILIVEDEKRIAYQLEKLIRQILDEEISRLNVCQTLNAARDFILRNTIDILFLDLNLKGLDGFSLLQEMVAGSFHTIIVSAYTDKAIVAFEYGVLDFVAKPFNKARLEQAIARFKNIQTHTHYFTKHLAIRKHGKIEMVNIEAINYIRAAGHYSELFLTNGKKELHNKSIDKLLILLPDNFERIHRSYAVEMNKIEKIQRYPGSKYEIILKDQTVLPCSRLKFKELNEKLK